MCIYTRRNDYSEKRRLKKESKTKKKERGSNEENALRLFGQTSLRRCKTARENSKKKKIRRRLIIPATAIYDNM